nr:MAG TPA: hypothetical protein [Caudoviricetes sp.]
MQTQSEVGLKTHSPFSSTICTIIRKFLFSILFFYYHKVTKKY